jgi:hypothetical protein
MNTVLTRTLEGLKLGEAQTWKNLAVFPILSDGDAGPDYITLGAALSAGTLRVAEMDGGATVPHIVVQNSGDKPVLLLDGEELAGAKQNRVLNTTVLLKPYSETTIDVSCSERGRWHHVSPEFRDSDVVMARGVRVNKSRSVSVSLESNAGFCSDQGAVWRDIDRLHEEVGSDSNTSAMRDAFEAQEDRFQDSLEAFPKVDAQCGLVFLADRAVLGLELLSRAEAFSIVHAKLVKSYLIDARPRNVESSKPVTEHAVSKFVEQVMQSPMTGFPSAGLGTDVRINHRTLCGSALVVEQVCIHAAFFSNVPFADEPNLRGFRERRRSFGVD